MTIDKALEQEVRDHISLALREDIGRGDLTGQLIPAESKVCASIMTRETMTMAGQPWVDEVFRQIDPKIQMNWNHIDGDEVAAGLVLCTVEGPARSILSGERVALNYLQLLSATATVTRGYVQAVAGTKCTILDTRKTIPGLRLAQKYAVRCGGGENHRMGLFDAILIKENHILSSGGIAAAVEAARQIHPGKPVEVEVESIVELHEAMQARADRVLLDNFSLALLKQAVMINRDEGNPPAKLEASGGLTRDDIANVAATGVDYISVGDLTKNVQAIDLSMRIE